MGATLMTTVQLLEESVKPLVHLKGLFMATSPQRFRVTRQASAEAAMEPTRLKREVSKASMAAAMATGSVVSGRGNHPPQSNGDRPSKEQQEETGSDRHPE